MLYIIDVNEDGLEESQGAINYYKILPPKRIFKRPKRPRSGQPCLTLCAKKWRDRLDNTHETKQRFDLESVKNVKDRLVRLISFY